MISQRSVSAIPILPGARAVGIDVGATLVKLAASPGPEFPPGFHLAPREAIEQVAREVESARPIRVGLTGCGAPDLAARLEFDTARTDEFTAWRRGADRLRGIPRGGSKPYVLVSVGTGTSALLVKGDALTRIGGTALGGGTLVGLAQALLGVERFDELTALAQRGDRKQVDLVLADIYSEEESPLPGAMTAASFAKLALRRDPPASPADVASAIVGLVGENVGLICGGLAKLAGVEEIVFGGSALRDNPTLGELIRMVCLAQGLRPELLRNGEYAGALGALELAAEAP